MRGLLLFAFVSVGLALETKLLSPAELRTRVPMTPITDFRNLPLSVRTPDFQLTSSETEPLSSLRGQDRLGRPWQVTLGDAVRGAWKSEMQSHRTYYFAGYTGAAGSGPATWILALSFDQSHRPVPFFVTSHDTYDSQGLEDVLDLDGTGPELLAQDYWGNIMDDPGHYVTVLYQLRDFYWYRSDGRHGTHTFPAFEKWSVLWKNRPAELDANPSSKRTVRDLSNNPANGIHTRVIRAQENSIRVGSEAGCESVTVQTLVTDSLAGREIDLQPKTQSFVRLARTHAPVVLTGLDHWPDRRECDASIMWAGENH